MSTTVKSLNKQKKMHIMGACLIFCLCFDSSCGLLLVYKISPAPIILTSLQFASDYHQSQPYLTTPHPYLTTPHPYLATLHPYLTTRTPHPLLIYATPPTYLRHTPYLSTPNPFLITPHPYLTTPHSYLFTSHPLIN